MRYGLVPTTMTHGILVPILKKPNIDPSVPKNYRPIIVSTVFSKMMELCILEESSPDHFHALQFWFIEGRGTGMAIRLANDVIEYCNKRGSPVYTCALDAEMAFDSIPHSILLEKASGVIPDIWWRILHKWYASLTVQVKWNNKLSKSVHIEKGTRQGGLTSPFLFNLFYLDLVNDISEMTGGIKIVKTSYNIFVYADDLLLTSTTVTGLQRMINYVNNYIVEHGLSFNATKTKCITLGKCYLENTPELTLNTSTLTMYNEIDYLGAILSNDHKLHPEKRTKACRPGFYGLQNAGLCDKGVKPETASRMWKVALQPVLLYGCQAVNLTKTSILNMDKLQAKLVKSSLGLSKYMRTTPLLGAMGIAKVSTMIETQSINLLKSIMSNNSGARNFYLHMLEYQSQRQYNSFITKIHGICNSNNISMVKFMCDDTYASNVKTNMKMVPINDGLTDSVKMFLKNYSKKDKEMLKLLLSPF